MAGRINGLQDLPVLVTQLFDQHMIHAHSQSAMLP